MTRPSVVFFEVGVDADELQTAERKLSGLRIEHGCHYMPGTRVVSVDREKRTVTFTWVEQ